jgi:hypothetical protein
MKLCTTYCNRPLNSVILVEIKVITVGGEQKKERNKGGNEKKTYHSSTTQHRQKDLLTNVNNTMLIF